MYHTSRLKNIKALSDGEHIALRSPDPSTTRTNRDRVMVILGVFLMLFFIVAVYLALAPGDRYAGGKPRGPVKDPRAQSQPHLPAGMSSTPRTQ